MYSTSASANSCGGLAAPFGTVGAVAGVAVARLGRVELEACPGLETFVKPDVLRIEVARADEEFRTGRWFSGLSSSRASAPSRCAGRGRWPRCRRAAAPCIRSFSVSSRCCAELVGRLAQIRQAVGRPGGRRATPSRCRPGRSSLLEQIRVVGLDLLAKRQARRRENGAHRHRQRQPHAREIGRRSACPTAAARARLRRCRSWPCGSGVRRHQSGRCRSPRSGVIDTVMRRSG